MIAKKYIVFGAVAILLIFIAILLLSINERSLGIENVVSPEVDCLIIRERGFLASSQSVPVAVQASGEIMELVKNGSIVKTGDQILRTDTARLAEKIGDVELTIQTINTERQIHDAEYEFVAFRARNDLSLLKSQMELAKLKYAQAKAGLTVDERRLLAIDEKLANIDLEDTIDELGRQNRLLEKGFISQTMVEPFEQRYESAKERVRELKIRSALRAKGMPPEQLLALSKEIERFDALLERDTARTERNLEAVKKVMEIDDVKTADQENKLSLLQREQALAVTVAPTNGVVALKVFRDWRSGSRWADYKPGVMMHRNDYVANIVNPGKMSVQLMIHESDVHIVRTGMACRVYLPALPGVEFAGTLTDVGGIGRDRFNVAPNGFDLGRTSVIMFNAAVSLDDTLNEELRPGMSALVDIIVPVLGRQVGD